MSQFKLAEALLRRKELQNKIDRLGPINKKDLFETKMQRKAITESTDDILMEIPKHRFSDATAMYDHYSKQLRHVDAAIQQANWTTEISTSEDVLMDFVSPEPEPVKKDEVA